jgi:hypothetical protein
MNLSAKETSMAKPKQVKAADFKNMTGIATGELEDGQWHRVKGFIRKSKDGVEVKDFAAEICDQERAEGSKQETADSDD